MIAIVLLLWSVEDIRKQSISLLHLMIGGVLVVVVAWIEKDTDMTKMMIGVIPGSMLLLASVLGKCEIGEADGFVLSIIGGVYGIWVAIGVLFIGLSLVCVLTGCLLVMKRIHRKTRIPFLPFLTAGYLVCVGFTR